MIQLNTPYPATAYLTGFLRQHAARLDLDVAPGRSGARAVPARSSRATASRDIARRARGTGRRERRRAAGDDRHFLAHATAYVDTVDAVVRVLAGPRSGAGAAHRGRARSCPRGRGSRALAERAGAATIRCAGRSARSASPIARKHLASLYIDDLADVVRDGIDPRFELSRYGERLAASAPTFDPLRDALEGAPTLVDTTLDEIARELVARASARSRRPDRAVPRQRLRRVPHRARDRSRRARRRAIALGGGYVNTELRELVRPARVRLRRLRHARRRRAPAARAPRAPRAIRTQPLFRTFVRDAAGASCSHRSPRCTTCRCATPARRPTTACRSIATCRCSRCSTRCTACGPTAAGTS